ncbi:MAG TPA: hypothetical protein PKU97_02755, partial [Kofleriaceae bacterium]|nr:hypothetical protein [Kofleriaceae bacterium]
GFRPGDPHAVTAAAALRAIPRLWAAELGASYQRPAFSIAAAAHVSWQAGELAWLPEARTLVSTPQVRRTALDARATVEPTSWLSLGVSFELAKALALAGQPHEHTLPLAPTFLGSAFALVRRCDSYASLRAAALGARLAALAETTGDQAPPSPERTASGHLLLQLTAGTRWRGISFALTVDNVLNSEWRQEQAAIATRPTPTAEVRPDVSFTPGEPRTLWLTVGIGG